MLIRTIEQLEAEGRVISISHGKATAVRLLTKSDRLGFSLSEARASQAGQSELWYKHHWEANYVRSGNAVLENRTTGERWPLEPGVLYCVGPKDRHRIIREHPSDMRIISVFKPPIEGNETHDDDGAYPPTGEIPRGQDRMFVKTIGEVRQAGMERTVAGGAAVSARYLTAADHLGFSFSAVRLQAGAEADLWYKHHWEANLVLEGALEVTDAATGEVHQIGPSGLYLVGPKDRHHVKALTDVHAVSVFNPPLTGEEVHDQDGSYPPTGPIPPGPVDI
jgi:L-ectoine synthase